MMYYPSADEEMTSSVEAVSINVDQAHVAPGCQAVLHTVKWDTHDYVPMRQTNCAISLTLADREADEKGYWQIDGTSEAVQLGTCGAIAANTTVEVRLPPGTKRAVACFFDPEHFMGRTGAPSEWFDPSFLARLAQRDAGPRRVLAAIAEELSVPRFARDVAIEGHTLLLLSEIARIIHGENGEERIYLLSQADLETIREIVQSELHMNVSLARVASAVGISRRHLSRSFKATTGLTFRTFVETERMKRTCDLLEKTDLPLKVIAHQVGLSGTSYLVNAFSRWKGTSPGSWRRQLKRLQ